MLWNSIKNKKPLAYITGCFDGKKSEKLLVKTNNGNYHVVEMYEGILDGTEFCEFYDDRDWEIKNVEYWIEIEKP
jgi:hypothetical protein